MALAAVDSRTLLQETPPELAVFFQFFGTVCSVATVAKVGFGRDGCAIDIWVHLSDDDESGQNTLYDALQRFRADGEGTLIDLHVIFANESHEAWPASARVVFSRE